MVMKRQGLQEEPEVENRDDFEINDDKNEKKETEVNTQEDKKIVIIQKKKRR